MENSRKPLHSDIDERTDSQHPQTHSVRCRIAISERLLHDLDSSTLVEGLDSEKGRKESFAHLEGGPTMDGEREGRS